jgi:hypothetical protein
MNDPLFTADYSTYNVEVVKRLSGKSQVLTGFDVSHYDTWGFASAISQDIATDTGGLACRRIPNRLTYNNRQDYWHWQYKFSGATSCRGRSPRPASIRITKGEPYGRTLNTTGLTQGTVNLTVEPIGTFFYPTVRLLDLRFSKSVRMGNSKLEGSVRRLQRHQFSRRFSASTRRPARASETC